MNNKMLGTLALLGAPSLLLGMHLEQTYPSLSNSWFTGVWGITYISAWIASIAALRRLQATGNSRFGKALLWIITGTLILANTSNVYQLIAPKDKSTWFLILDSFWPISNLIMLVVGITVIEAKVLLGWQRFIPLVVGLWFPLTMLTMAFAGRDAPIMVFVPYYTAIAWGLLAIVVLTTSKKLEAEKVSIINHQLA